MVRMALSVRSESLIRVRTVRRVRVFCHKTQPLRGRQAAGELVVTVRDSYVTRRQLKQG
jgi:hypothetical protein